MRNEGVGSWATRRARMSPNRVAVVHDDREWTYAAVADRANRAAHALRSLGVRPGDRVGYLGPNHPTFLEAFFGTGQLGAVFVPLNIRLAAPELAFILADCGVDVLIYAPGQSAVVAALRELVALRHTVALEPCGDDPDYATLLDRAASDPLDEPVPLDETGVVLYTSGTTGRPKGVRLSHGNLAWNSFNMLIDVDLAADEVTLVTAPMFHVAALNQTVLPTFLKGGRSVLVPAFDPSTALDLIERHRVTFMFGVPSMFAAIAAAPGWSDADLSCVRSMICGGAPVPEPLIRTYQRRGLTFMQGYGMTETSPGALFLRAADSGDHAGSAGTPVFFSDVRLRDATGAEVPPGVHGEIVVHGPNVMTGYWGRAAETAEVLSADGWFRSGDLAVVDADGYFHIRDRVGDMFISGGENVYPAEVEEALSRHPAVAECAVIGVDDERWGEVGRAIVVPRPGMTVDPAELLASLDGRIARYKIPKSVVYVDSLPRTGSGKVLKTQLRRAHAGTGDSAGPAWWRTGRPPEPGAGATETAETAETAEVSRLDRG
ncbi:long-chain fatty acid--CoA ligase [Plantactinospora solaniradicis]|uniref:Long-chain fatty acid--CoA ligase n=1 Tax=Plantactinospora solaniradicis TaxID=1723736 RepID=A0ABW1K7Z8_9ACTN